MGTPHNNAEIGQIAKNVIMPGDPNRAKLIAEKYLENYKLNCYKKYSTFDQYYFIFISLILQSLYYF